MFKRKHSSNVDSPAYDASEEDNDPLTDDAASTVSLIPLRYHVPPSPLTQSRPTPATGTMAQSVNGNVVGSMARFGAARTRQTTSQLVSALSGVVSDDGVDSPTYDGDVETTTSLRASHQHTHGHVSGACAHHTIGTTSRLSGSSTSTLTSPTSVSFPDGPETASPGQRRSADEHGQSQEVQLISDSARVAAETRSSQAATGGSVSRRSSVPGKPAPVPVAAAEFNPAVLTSEEIQSFVRAAINSAPLENGKERQYKINNPPEGRPVRIYADGVYDLFHFGHALQLRQAKNSFPSVYLLVGVNSDELVKKHKSSTVMTHVERCEAVRHCRWVDEVVQEAPWVIDAAFLEKWKIDYVVHDEDPYASSGHDDVYAFAKSQGQFIPTRRTPGISTSELLVRVVAGYRRHEFDNKLEKVGAAELKVEKSNFDGRPGTSRPSSHVAGGSKWLADVAEDS